MNTQKKKSTLWLAIAALYSLFTMAVCSLTFVAATYAWFTFSLNTNVTPMEGTTSQGDVNLVISASEGGPYDVTAPVSILNSCEDMIPLSTLDMVTWYGATGRTTSGVTFLYAEKPDALETDLVHGEIYVKSEYMDADMYFSKQKMTFDGPAQLLASLRMGMIITTQTGTETYIFKLDDAADTGGAESRVTSSGGTDSVVSGVDSKGNPSYDPDPALDMAPYTANDGESDTADPEPGQTRLCRLTKDEPARVELFFWMEGCDENTLNEAQASDLSFDLAFCGVKLEDAP